MTVAERERAIARTDRERREQGLPARVEDPMVLARIVSAVRVLVS